MYFTQMFDEIPFRPPYFKDPAGMRQIRDYKHMLAVLNRIFGRAPEWTDAAYGAGVVGVPVCAIFDFPMGTARSVSSFLSFDISCADREQWTCSLPGSGRQQNAEEGP